MSAPVADIFAPVAPGLAAVERRLIRVLDGDAPEIANLARATITSGGKRLRPALVLLFAGLADDDGDSDGNAAVSVAAGMELVHAATLIHDDVIDDSPTRRGTAAVHAVAGAGAAIIVGDHYLAEGLGLIAQGGGATVVQEATATVMAICAGEIRQMRSHLDLDRSVADYEAAMDRKTAGLLSVSCGAGARIAGLGDAGIAAARAYGRELGMAFQLADDLLDWSASATAMGKPVLADLRQGVVTLPLMLALADADVGPELRRLLAAELDNAGAESVARCVRASGAVDATSARAREFATRASTHLSAFADTAQRVALELLCDFVVARTT